MNKLLGMLSAKVEAICPIEGMDGLAIRFKESATPAQRAAAQAILDQFDPKQALAEIEAEEKSRAEKAAALEKLADWMQRNPVEAVKLMEVATLETRVAAIEAKVEVVPVEPKAIIK